MSSLRRTTRCTGASRGQALADPDRVIRQDDGRWVFEKAFKTPAGLDIDGKPTNIVRVAVNEAGELVTTFPWNAWK